MRLIDADALVEAMKKDNPQTSKNKWLQILIDNAPTVQADRPTADEELQMWKDAQKLKDRITDLEEELLKYKSADRPQGEWIYKTNNESVCEEWECSKCGNWTFMKTNYCPNCGAEMRGGVK